MAAPQIKNSPVLRFLPEILILLLALILRVQSLGFGLPHLYHADEPIIVNHALRFGTGDFNPHFFNVPPLTSYLLFALYGFLFLTGNVLGYFHSATEFSELFFRDPTIFYLFGRALLGVLPAVLSVAALMHWLKRLGWLRHDIWIASTLFAVCFVHVSDAHYIYTDMMLVLTAIGFFQLLHGLDLNLRRGHLILGGIIGLAAAIKYNGVFLAAPYLWMICCAKPGRRILFAVCGASISIAAFIALNPFSVLDFHFFMAELAEQNAANPGVPFWHHLTYSLAEGMGWPVLILSFAGSLAILFSKDRKLQSIVFFTLIYYCVLWQKAQPFGRYILPLVPFIIVLAVWGWRVLMNRFQKMKCFWLGLVMGGVLLNLIKDIQFNCVLKADTRTQAVSWIESHIPPGSRIALDGTSLTPRLSFSCSALQDKLNQLTSQTPFDRVSRQRLEFKLQKCDEKTGYELYFMADQPGLNPFVFASPEILRDMNSLRMRQIQYAVIVPEFLNQEMLQNIRQEGKLIKFWDSRPKQSSELEIFDPQVITGGPFTWKDLFARNSNGYRIELYELGLEGAAR